MLVLGTLFLTCSVLPRERRQRRQGKRTERNTPTRFEELALASKLVRIISFPVVLRLNNPDQIMSIIYHNKFFRLSNGFVILSKALTVHV
jgi:hypothetical protein